MNENIFFIAGAQRCGTTWLYTVLNSHPQVHMNVPSNPEPKFFLREVSDTEVENYLEKHFPNRETVKLIGDKSTSYLEYPETAKRINHVFPNSRIIVTLRNPVPRAISNFHFSTKNKLEIRTVEEVFLQKLSPAQNQNLTSVSPFAYLQRGDYINYIEPYYKVFGKDRLKIIILEELVLDFSLFQDIASFLNISPFDLDNIPTNKTNETQGIEQISAEIIDVLKLHFEPKIDSLEQFLGRSIKVWK